MHLFLLAIVALLGAAVVAELRRERALGIDPLTQIDVAAVHMLAVSCKGCKPRRFEKSRRALAHARTVRASGRRCGRR